MKKICLFLGYFVLMILFPIFIFNQEVPGSILNDAGSVQITYYICMNIAFMVAATVGYLKINDIIK